MSEFSQEQIKILEQTRQLLVQLTEALGSFHRDLQSPQFPQWSSITTHNSIVSFRLQAYYQHLSQHTSFLNAISIYPLPSFSGKNQEILLTQVLRKKPDPEVEEWASEAAKETEMAAKVDSKGEESEQSRLMGLWKQAPLISKECSSEHTWGGDYTKKEVKEGRENVVTGLKRKWDKVDEGEEDEDEAGEEETGVRMVVVKEKKAEMEEKKKKDRAKSPVQLSQILSRGPPEAGTRKQ